MATDSDPSCVAFRRTGERVGRCQREQGGAHGFPLSLSQLTGLESRLEVVWDPSQGPIELLMALRTEMVKHNFGEEAKLVGPDLFEHLGTALADAVAGRIAEDGAWVVGALDEWLADGWVITDAGPFSRDHGSIEQSEFPKPEFGSGPNRNIFSQKMPPSNPPVPDGVSEGFWKFAVARATQKFGNRPLGFIGGYASSQPRHPFNRDDSPRNDSNWIPLPRE